MRRAPLGQQHIVIAGAGLAGLTAARDLEMSGATITLIDARDRVGGRVHTLRGFAGGHHVEGGADLIEGEQTLVHDLAREVGLKPTRILRRGFGYYGPDRAGRHRIHRAPAAFEEAAERLAPLITEYRASGRDWDSPVARAIARQSVAGWLRATRAPRDFAAAMRGLRGFFLADPEDLSLLALVDQFAQDGSPGDDAMFRLPQGNDTLPRALQERLRGRVLLETTVRRIRTSKDAVRITVEGRNGLHEIAAAYFISAIPATTLTDVEFDPPLPADQQRAIRLLQYGRATRVVLHFARRFWRRPARPRAFGTPLPIGAVWEGNEQQRGAAGFLTLLAGGAASPAVREIIGRAGMHGLVRHLAWLGRPAKLLDARTVTWEDDPWARGGYAYFDPAFDPRLRGWLSRPAGRVVFAGEHTSHRWQGYMNGAIESGRRAAAEIRALVALDA
ncbi:MAG TPA: NAD(P)/FAD-dependent oxidoreductase [Vicinamibacterales bacterium]|nr:NAD(P)/FAD-dependent oxidoreductase [Vicinamibacterales bacterium]